MKSTMTILLIQLFLCLYSAKLEAQINRSLLETKVKIGFIYGYSTQGEFGLETDYNYNVFYYQAQFYRSLLTKDHTGIELVVQPQYNRSKIIPDDKNHPDIVGYEIGLNLGLLIRRELAENMLSLYILISSGPHYASKLPIRQSDGFIFSDNLFIGLTLNLKNGSYLDIRPGFRHLSNAGIEDPNGGVNSLIISGGLVVALN